MILAEIQLYYEETLTDMFFTIFIYNKYGDFNENVGSTFISQFNPSLT